MSTTMALGCRSFSPATVTVARLMKSRAAKANDGRASMKGSCSVWAVTGLLICCVGSGFAVAASKSVSMNLRVLVDAPPPCTVMVRQLSLVMYSLIRSMG